VRPAQERLLQWLFPPAANARRPRQVAKNWIERVRLIGRRARFGLIGPFNQGRRGFQRRRGHQQPHLGGCQAGLGGLAPGYVGGQ
jgi:hypothetical protein